MNPEPSVGSVPPRSIRPRIIAVCTNGGRHKRTELLRLAVIRTGVGPPVLVQFMSTQPGRSAMWTLIQATVRAADGHQVITVQCPRCKQHLKYGAVNAVTAAIARMDPGAPTKEVDVSGP